jgi:NADH:ubiquinone oxidoreductase subunit F (NADH-binding)
MTRPLEVVPGPWLLRAPSPDLATHRALRGPLPSVTIADLLARAERSGLRGRGGAAFPFATKLRATATAAKGRPGRRHVVVNLSEGEPASFKDLALAVHQPQLVLDGASLAAGALGTREIHLVTPVEQPVVARALTQALDERHEEDRGRRLHWRLHTAAPRFVAGEASAVTELIQGRDNLPVTSWVPTAVAGVSGDPTLLSNAETYAQLAALVLGGPAVPGTVTEPGTRLLTIGGLDGGARVVEVPHGTPWRAVLGPAELRGPVLLGGYHGTWAPAGLLERLTVSHADLAAAGLGLGAGVVLPLPTGACPLRTTAGIVRYLARQSAGRCGPCFHGLPALATAFDAFVGGGPIEPVETIVGLVAGRGACAHPDGTARLVRSVLTAFPEEVEVHAVGGCVVRDRMLLDAVGAR